MNTAWPTTPPAFEMIAFAYDGWSVLRIEATNETRLTYEATHPELPGDVFVAHSLGEARALIDDETAWWQPTRTAEFPDAQAAHEADEAAAYAAWEAEQDALCKATRHAGSVSEPYGIGCDLPDGHDGAHKVTDPFGPDTGAWTWPVGPHRGITRMDA